MQKYHKIHSPFNRDDKGNFIFSEWARPEFELLQDVLWTIREKVDGTNIRVMWDRDPHSDTYDQVFFGGRTDNAQIPDHLMKVLEKTFTPERFSKAFDGQDRPGTDMSGAWFGRMILHGEGFGSKIQKIGSQYISDGAGFVLFDVELVHPYTDECTFMAEETITEFADKLDIARVPLHEPQTLRSIINEVGDTSRSDLIPRSSMKLGKPTEENPPIEGFVVHPLYEMQDRRGDRIITKIKYRDFKRETES